ncbi:MAG: DNA polymerase III subunit gamma/tau [Oligoflexia bacterium]|nr:DNA polymerase III subunit gamma/tau [Oligoflexia bacterium]
MTASTGSYIVLARKWRPAQFSDIVGQGHIVRTLSNAIRSQRIHQAYLFTGSRGIGKTSIARIFAKALRCEHSRVEGDWLRSCDECASCKEITGGNGIDVIEIDGASNNGVDAVREIRENAKYMPSTGARKIYIIDEVHMLTTQAFNALLKTLEEPPAHVIFIFATTEPHKIPATILSRCQRFDFRRVTLAQIQARLAEITQSEGTTSEPGALALIARAAEGSMRDALSLLDQVIAFSGNHITVHSVRESVGLVEGQTILGILAGVFGRKPIEALQLVEQAYSRGHDLRVLTRSLIEFLHGTVLAKIGATNSATLELSEEEWKELRAIAELRSLEEIELIFQVLHHGLDWIAHSPQPKIVLDVLLVKCATADALVEMNSPAPAGTEGAGPRPGTTLPGAQASAAGPALKSAPMMTTTAASVPAAAPVAAAAPAIAPKPAVSTVSAPQATPARDPNATTTAATAATAPEAASGPKSWEGFIERIRQSRPLLATLLEHGICAKLPTTEDSSISIHFAPQDAYYRDQLQSRVYHEQILSFLKDYFGRHVSLQIQIKDEGESLAARKEREHKERERDARAAAQNHPIIIEARSLFGGELGPIELTNEEDPRG